MKTEQITRITPNQMEILQILMRYRREQIPPTHRRIAQERRHSNWNGTSQVIDNLEKKGLIERPMVQGKRVIVCPWHWSIPIYGKERQFLLVGPRNGTGSCVGREVEVSEYSNGR
jgi:SOS-response transcriptional repressor LexA